MPPCETNEWTGVTPHRIDPVVRPLRDRDPVALFHPRHALKRLIEILNGAEKYHIITSIPPGMFGHE
jgi:hypothetical protein